MSIPRQQHMLAELIYASHQCDWQDVREWAETLRAWLRDGGEMPPVIDRDTLYELVELACIAGEACSEFDRSDNTMPDGWLDDLEYEHRVVGDDERSYGPRG